MPCIALQLAGIQAILGDPEQAPGEVTTATPAARS